MVTWDSGVAACDALQDERAITAIQAAARTNQTPSRATRTFPATRRECSTIMKYLYISRFVSHHSTTIDTLLPFGMC